MKKIGITGNIACGKSVAFDTIKSKGFDIIDSDDIVKTLYKNNQFIDEVFTNFPQIIVNDVIDCKLLSDLIFSDSDFKNQYEEFIFPKVREKISDFLNKNKDKSVVFVIVPLLFEAGFESLFDNIIFISSDENIRKERLIKRKSLLSDMAQKVIKSQIEEEKKIPQCDYVIKNNGTLENFKNTVNNCLKNFY